MKNFFLTYLYPVSFFFLSFCGHNNKEHHIAYEQMPLEVKTDASEEVKGWISTFKKGYFPRHLDQVVNLIFNEAWKNSKTNIVQDATQKENIELLFDASETLAVKKNVLNRIDTNDIFKFKSNLELFIKNDLEKSAESLTYNNATTNPLRAISHKEVSHSSYTQLIQLLFTKTQGQNKLRKKELYLIFTPDRISIGFVKKDDVQGKLLFGISSTNLGSKAIKSYGPTQKLTGNIAVVDFEMALILSALSDKITNLKDARQFALDQSAKKTGIQLSKLTLNFKDSNPLVFELNGTPFENAAPSNGQKLVEADFSYVEGASALNLKELKASYKSYLDNEKRKENDKKKISNTSSVLGSFHGWSKAVAFVAVFFSSKKDYAPTSKILRMPVTRKCHAETPNNDKKDYLRDWYIFGPIRSYWKYDTLEEDHLSYCQNKKNLGESDDDESTTLIQAQSRILQPIFVALPKNPKNPETLPAEEDVLEIHNQQEKLVNELALDFCSQLNMKSVLELESLKNNQDVLNIWKELFHGDEQTTTQAFPNNAKNNNFYEIKCISLGSKTDTTFNNDTNDRKELDTKDKTDAKSKKTTSTISLQKTPLLPTKR